MTRQDRQKLVLDLYNQGKNIREIAKEARMSFRDIGIILNKADEGRMKNDDDEIKNKKQQQEQEPQQQLSLSTQAYKLFSEGKSLIQVAVALNQKELLFISITNCCLFVFIFIAIIFLLFVT
jgi:transposase